MNPPNPVGKALETFAWLEKEIATAQKGPIDPRMRAELARVASATKKSLAGLAASQKSADEMLAAKRQRAAKAAAANQAAIAKNRAKMAAKKQPAPATTPPKPVIDPSLGALLANELLARQAKPEIARGEKELAKSVLEDWEWAPASAASSGTEVPCG